MKCADKDLLLYAVTDRYWLGERTLHDVVKESLAALHLYSFAKSI